MIHTRPMTPAEIAARDAAICARLRGAGLTTEREFPQISAEAECLAADMIYIAGGIEGHCTDADLIGRGWTPYELTRHGAAARQLALGKSRTVS
ncbi:hypothetical protein VQ042_17995 [Aurantimonas sp. A2-1-M11]|uniref:hypothetical protein n=1 Tax=Aurantimonas sp. A2-1-M11 TaxID=3113712 RepID=UPI002F936A1A